jgi:hypothetical protein
MARYLSDGNIPFGSEIVTINGTDYVAEEIDFHEKSTAIYRRDERNIPNGGVYIKDLLEGTMTLQLGSLTTPIPEGQSQVTIPFRGADVLFVITDVQQPKKQNEIRKMKMKITEILNPGNVVEG